MIADITNGAMMLALIVLANAAQLFYNRRWSLLQAGVMNYHCTGLLLPTPLLPNFTVFLLRHHIEVSFARGGNNRERGTERHITYYISHVTTVPAS